MLRLQGQPDFAGSSIVIDGSPTIVRPRDPIRFTVTVTNRGTAVANGVSIRVPLDALVANAVVEDGGLLAASLATVAIAMGSVPFLGTEFMPKLDEGSILIETRKLPLTSLRHMCLPTEPPPLNRLCKSCCARLYEVWIAHERTAEPQCR